MGELLPDTIVESREELMVSPTGQGEFTFRRAHFLKPCIESSRDDGNDEEDPFSRVCTPSLPPVPSSFQPKKWPLTVHFHGWRYPQREWKDWVKKMESLHAYTWREAGIHEAILSSTYKINRCDELVLGLAERWCPETKSFVFSWGEATVTLEDVAIISGYSVLGCPIFSPLDEEELVTIHEMLAASRSELAKTSARKACQCAWLKKFKDSGSEIEHEAFLALWLSRFVLVTSRDIVWENTFPVAILLARGTRVALAPAVLASIYRDLGLLKEAIVALSSLESRGVVNYDDVEKETEGVVVALRSPFQLVQVWVCERFPALRAKSNLIRDGEPRLARWDDAKYSVRNNNVRLVLHSSEDSFIWRPYARGLRNRSPSFPKYYPEGEMWLLVGLGSDEELLSFVRFLRVSELVGLDCIEQYLPHRVAMQFGIDQDVPSHVPRCNDIPDIAWSCYDHSVSELLCYVPSRFSAANVTSRYLKWWNKSVGILQNTIYRTSQEASGSSRMPIGSSKDEHKSAKAGAKLVRGFQLAHKRAKEWKGASTFNKVKVNNSKGNNKWDVSSGFKIAPKKLNAGKHGKTFVSNLKTMSKRFKGSGNRIKAKKHGGNFRVSPVVLKDDTSKEMAEDHSPTLDPTSQPKHLKESVVNSVGGKKCPTSDMFDSALSSPSRKRKEGEYCLPASLFNPSQKPKHLQTSFDRKKLMDQINSPVPPGFPPKSSFPSNQFKGKASCEDQQTISEALTNSMKQQNAEKAMASAKTLVLNKKHEASETIKVGHRESSGASYLGGDREWVLKSSDPDIAAICTGGGSKHPLTDVTKDNSKTNLSRGSSSLSCKVNPGLFVEDVNNDPSLDRSCPAADGRFSLLRSSTSPRGFHSPSVGRSQGSGALGTPTVSTSTNDSGLEPSCHPNPPSVLSGASSKAAPGTYVSLFEGPSYTDFHGFRVLHQHVTRLQQMYNKEGAFWGDVHTLGEYTISHLLNVIGDVHAIGALKTQASLDEKDAAFIVKYIEICKGLGFRIDCLKPLLVNAKSLLRSLQEKRLRSTMEQDLKALEVHLCEAKTIESRLSEMKQQLATLNQSATPGGSSKGASLAFS